MHSLDQVVAMRDTTAQGGTGGRPARDYHAEYVRRTQTEGSFVRQFVAPGWVSAADACRLLGWPSTARHRLLAALNACRLRGHRKRFLRNAFVRKDGRRMHLTWWEIRLECLKQLVRYQLVAMWEQDRRVSPHLRDVPLPACLWEGSRAKAPRVSSNGTRRTPLPSCSTA